MSEHILDAIHWISKGKSTRLKIGSRAMPHRLKKIEKEQENLKIEQAINKLRKYLSEEN